MNYLDLYNSGELLQRVKSAYARLASCDLCPHDCRVNRLRGETGICRSGLKPKIASANLHRGEEPPISGSRGSGTIFFSGCSLKCKFCQNFPISQLGSGNELSTLELAGKMLTLQRRRAHNINFVTPTHFLPQILAALWLAISKGFKLPIVWNSSGYEKVDALQLLEGIVSVYLPDMKYSDNQPAVDISSVPGYMPVNRLAVLEMFRQAGHLQVDEEGVAVKGIIIRHLVLPGGKAGTSETLQWIAGNLGVETDIALMSQYFPAHTAVHIEGINRSLTHSEYEEATAAL
ncbi:MAG TPA: radical SAM protein, partial [Geobacteraceae bacterium]|nr:radical SAM protein [Geobacteraceae bacterium]